MSVRVALNATFYFDGGDVFVMDEDPDETVAQLGQRAVVLKGAGSNQTEKECFVRFLVFHGGEFVEQSKKTTEFSRDDVFYIRDIGREGSYETAIEKKIEGIPLAIYIRTAPNIKGSKLRDGWFPAYPKFTVGQFKTFILSLTNYFDANFWTDGQLLSNNSKMCKTIMKNGTVIVVSSDSENVAEDMGSPIFEASGYAPSLDMFQLPTLPPVRARDADTDSSAVETDSEDGCTAIPITLTNPYTGEIDKVMYPQNMTLGELMKKMHLTYYEPEPDASMPATIQVAFPFASHDCAVPAYSTVPSSGEATLVELNQKMDGMKSVEILMDVGSVKRRYLYWYDGSARFEHLFELLRENGIDVGGLRDDPPPSYILKGSRSTAMRHEIVSDWGFNAVGFGIVPYLAGGGKSAKTKVKKDGVALKRGMLSKLVESIKNAKSVEKNELAKASQIVADGLKAMTKLENTAEQDAEKTFAFILEKVSDKVLGKDGETSELLQCILKTNKGELRMETLVDALLPQVFQDLRNLKSEVDGAYESGSLVLELLLTRAFYNEGSSTWNWRRVKEMIFNEIGKRGNTVSIQELSEAFDHMEL